MPPPKGDFAITLLKAENRYYTGLQVNKDPGVWLIWLGCGLILAGFLVTFFLSHQKVFIGLFPNDKGVEIVAAGSTHRNPGSFRIRFDALAADIEAAIKSGDAKK